VKLSIGLRVPGSLHDAKKKAKNTKKVTIPLITENIRVSAGNTGKMMHMFSNKTTPKRLINKV